MLRLILPVASAGITLCSIPSVTANSLRRSVMQNSLISTYLRLVGMAALWGASWPLGRAVAQAMPPVAAAAIRFLIASVVLMLWMHHTSGFSQLRKVTGRQWIGLAIAALAGVFGYSLFFMFSLQLVPAGKAAIVVTLNPGATLLLAAILFKERLNPQIFLGMALSGIGAYIALGGGATAGSSATPTSAIGVWLLIGCVASWVAYTLIGRLILRGVDSLTTTTATSAIGSLMLLLTSLAYEGPASWRALGAVEIDTWVNLFALAFGATAVAYTWHFHGVKVLGAGAAAGFVTLVPVFGVLFANLLLAEPISKNLFFGAALAVIGMVVMHFGRRQAERRT